MRIAPCWRGHVPIRLAERRRVGRAEIRRRFHAGKDHFDAARIRALDDRRQVLAQLLDRQAPQRVVAAERDHQNLHVPVERPIDAAQSAG